ncbi:5-deoxy-glucuronate isomerase [Paenibacillus forsythiae]|uniref:5-deoxy-glucuronate isomerase n=1 Tax=Paenibacillus forsythiae TaxID=365616 RepID=A0ABU3H4L7_9BACL|nr:5-deoxy-glucuronate isomerase [Paenibacillus forsythiae]MDT3425767.1 5-deoxy-glucuronate isomerase [Paenibacillus forsythiae]
MELKFTAPRTPGLHRIVGPGDSELEVLELFVLNLPSGGAQRVELEGREASLVCIEGKLRVAAESSEYILLPGDGLYVPRGRAVTIEGVLEQSRLVMAAAEAWSDAEFIYADYGAAYREKEVHGRYNYTRDIVNLLTRSDRASRIVTGITTGQDGAWTSWPPHHHSDTLEEIYFYFDIPEDGFGVHVGMLMDGTEQAEIVRSGDAVIIPGGYHPTVASPGARMKYVWFLGARNSEEDRRAPSEDHPVYG